MTETPAPARRGVPLSDQQQFLTMVDHGDGYGPFGPRYTIAGGWRLRGPIDVPALHAALGDVVARHESLRTELVPAAGYQLVHPPTRPDLEVWELPATPDGAARERVAEELVNTVEAGPFAMSEQPQLRMVLGRFDDTDAVLVLMAHHTAVDGWSAQVVIDDLAAHYAARIDGTPCDLPPARQFREYVAWQQQRHGGPAERAAREYWRTTLAGGSMVALPTDRPRPDSGPFATGYHRFVWDEWMRAGTVELAARTRTSPFMVVLAAYLARLRDTTGRTDLVVPTFTPGRSPGWVTQVVGSFYNFLPLRVDLAGCAGFGEILAATRTACLGAYRHELPFAAIIEEAPELMDAAIAPDGACCVLQVIQSPFMLTDAPRGGLRFTAMRRRVLSVPVGSQIPDGGLIGLEPQRDGGIVGSVGYTTNVFDESSAVAMADDLQAALGAALVGAGVEGAVAAA